MKFMIPLAGNAEAMLFKKLKMLKRKKGLKREKRLINQSWKSGPTPLILIPN